MQTLGLGNGVFTCLYIDPLFSNTYKELYEVHQPVGCIICLTVPTLPFYYDGVDG